MVDQDFADETEFLVLASENSSVTERKAISLEREVEDIKKAEYELMDQNYRDYFSDERSRTFDEIAEYNFNKEEFESKYGAI